MRTLTWFGLLAAMLLPSTAAAQSADPLRVTTLRVTSTADTAVCIGNAVGASPSSCTGGLDAGKASISGTTAGAMAIAGDFYSHVLLAIGFNGVSPLNEPHQVGAYSAVRGNSYTGTGVTGAAATDGYVIGFETALETAAGGATVPWVVNYSIGSVTKGSGDTIVRTIGVQSIDETAGTHNAFIAPYYASFVGNWFVYYPGSRPSWLGEGDLTIGHEVYRSINDDYIRVSGGNGAGTGASLSLFGGAHASAANKAFLTASAGFTVTGATSITGNTAVTGTFGVTGDTTIGTEIYRSANDSYSRVSGGNGAGTGANVVLYGGSHASAANKIAINGSGGVAIVGATAITGNTSITGTLSATGDTTLGAEVFRSSADSYLRVAGGSSSSGAVLLLFGQSHATNANKAFLTATAGVTITGAVDMSATLLVPTGYVTTLEAGELRSFNGVDIAGNPPLNITSALRLNQPANATVSGDTTLYTYNYPSSDPTYYSVLRITTADTTPRLVGLTAGFDGQVIIVINTTSTAVTLVHDATATAANRLLLPDAGDWSLGQDESAWFWYDTTSDRWRLIAIK